MAARRLAEFLSEAADRGFAWGSHDCMLFAADWAATFGRDPAAALRGTYADEVDAAAIVMAAGGPLLQVHRALGPCGWRPISSRHVAEGDIVLAHPPHQSERAGIVTSAGRVAFLLRRGLLVCRPNIVAAWRYIGAGRG